MKKKPRKLTLVSWMPVGRATATSPLRRDKPYLFLGEIRNMRTHCAVVDVATGRIHVGYHTSNFVEIPDSET
jgi:hypothetical protein